jgi:NitT/TauT family transport system substrate-binding protein
MLKFPRVSLPTLVLTLSGVAVAQTPEKITMIMPWTAQAEQGGFWQAAVKGIYKKYGIDMVLRPGGPQLNTAQMLAAGAVDFRVSRNSGETINFAINNAPGIAVAALLQKEPVVFITHPDVGINSFEDMRGKPIAISQSVVDTWWRYLKAKYGFTDAQVRPYTFQIAPFLVNKDLVQQGFLTSEPFAIEKTGGFKPKVFLIADTGWEAYSTLIETTTDMVAKKLDLVQRVVDSSIEGWYGYMYGDRTEANAAIKTANPDMSDAQLAYSFDKMKEYGIVDSGDTIKLGIGAMTDERWKKLVDTGVAAGIYPANVDYKKTYTLKFVNKGIGLNLRK